MTSFLSQQFGAVATAEQPAADNQDKKSTPPVQEGASSKPFDHDAQALKEFSPDPAPWLESDSLYWSIVLGFAGAEYPPLEKLLHGFRCMGCELFVSEGGLLRMRPRLEGDGVTSQYEKFAEYRADRDKYLMPMKDRFVKVLSAASQLIREKGW